MKKKNVLLLLSLLPSLFLVSCNSDADDSSNNGSSSSIAEQITFDAPSSFNLKLNQSDYAFADEISVSKDGEEIEFSLDTTKIDFANAGQYSLIVKAGNASKEIPVYVYGMPTITCTLTKTTFQYQEKSQVKNGFSAKDSFGNDLDVEIRYKTDAIGIVSLGEQEVTASATDAAGNVVSLEATVTIEKGIDIHVNDLTVDLSDPENFVISRDDSLSKYTNAHLAYNGKLLADNEFLLGYKIAKSYLKSIGIGTYTMNFVCEEGYTTFNLTITDKEEAKVIFDLSYDNEIFLEGDTKLPDIAIQDEDSYQNLVFEYSLTKDGVDFQIDDESFLPAGEYSYSVDVKRGDAVLKNAKVDFAVYNEVDYYCLPSKAMEHFTFASDFETSYDAEKDAIKVVLPMTRGDVTFSFGSKLSMLAKAAGRNSFNAEFLYGENSSNISEFWYTTTSKSWYAQTLDTTSNTVSLSCPIDYFTKTARSIETLFRPSSSASGTATIYITKLSFGEEPFAPLAFKTTIKKNSDGTYHWESRYEDTVLACIHKDAIAKAKNEGKTKLKMTFVNNGYSGDSINARIGTIAYDSQNVSENLTYREDTSWVATTDNKLEYSLSSFEEGESLVVGMSGRPKNTKMNFQVSVAFE